MSLIQQAEVAERTGFLSGCTAEGAVSSNIRMDGENVALGKPLPTKFATLSVSIPGASAWTAKYKRATLPPIHIVIEDLLSIASDDVLPGERLPKFCTLCSALAMHPQFIGGQVESAFFRVAAFMISASASQKSEASALCKSLSVLCANLLSHLLQEEGTFSEHSSQSSLLQLLAFIADCMSNSHFSAPFFESFGSKGFASLLAFCEECFAHVLSVEITSEAGFSMLEYMWTIYSLVASIFLSSAAHAMDASHFQNFVSQVSNAMIITKDFLHQFRRMNDLACVLIKIASVMAARPQPNMVSSFLVQCLDVIIRLRTCYLTRGQVDLLLSYLDCVAAIAEYSGCACQAAPIHGDMRNREGTELIQEALRTSTFNADEILPISCFHGTDRVVASWIANEIAFCSFVSEHFHEKILSKCAPTLKLLQRLNVLGFEQFQILWMKSVNSLCDSTNILKTKTPEIQQCLCIVDSEFALKILDSSVDAFSSNSSSHIRAHHLKSLHILAHHCDFQVVNAVLNALWSCVCSRCRSAFDVEDILEIMQNASAQFCAADFHLSHSMTLVPRLFSTLAKQDSIIEAIVACQVLHSFIDADVCVSVSECSFNGALVDSVKLFNSMCVQSIAPLSHSSDTLQEVFTWVCQLMLTLLLRQSVLFPTELLSSCLKSLASSQFLYDDHLKVDFFKLLVQVSLHDDLIESALTESITKHHLIDSVALLLSFLEHLSSSAVSDSLVRINECMNGLHHAMKKQIYLRCLQSPVMEHLWKICFQQLNKNLLNFFADVFVVASDPHVSSLSSELHCSISKFVASTVDSLSSLDASVEVSCLLHIIKFALNRRPSDCCFGALGLISPPVLICVEKEEPVMFQMATSFRNIQSTLCISPCSMIVCDLALDTASSLAHSVGIVIEQTHGEIIPVSIDISVEAAAVDFLEPVPLSLLPGILGPKFLPWLHMLAFSDSKQIRNVALDICCLLPSFDGSLPTHLNPSILDKFRTLMSSECAIDTDSKETFFSCFYACSLMAAYACNIGDLCTVMELSEEEVQFCGDFLSYCLSQLEGKSSAVWNHLYLIGILSSLQCLSKCSKSQLSTQLCHILLRLQELVANGGCTTDVRNSSSHANCPVGHMSTCRGIIKACFNLAADVACNHQHSFFSQFLNLTLNSMPSSFLHAAYDSVALSIQANRDQDVLVSIISACLAVPLLCKPFEFNLAHKLYSNAVSFLIRRPDFLNVSTRVELLVSACRAIDSIDWTFCHSIRNGQSLINQFLYICHMMLKIASDRARNSTEFPTSVKEITVKSFKSISCFVNEDGGSCGLASFRGDASTLIQSVRVSLSQLFSRLVDVFSCFVPFHVILSVLAKNHLK